VDDARPPLVLASAATTGPAAEARHEVERWFVRRGVPQLIAGYSSEPAMDARAAPFISAWLIAGTILFWGTRSDWPPLWNAAGIAATLLWMAAAWTVVSWVRHRPLTVRPERFDLLDILSIGLVPALPAAVIDASAGEGVAAFLGALTGIGVIYLVIGFGVIEIALWAVQRLGLQLAHIVELVARTLPLLLILVVFLLFTGELWQAAHHLHPGELAAILLLLVLAGMLLVLTSFRAELRGIEARHDVDGILADARTTPAAPLANAAAGPLVESAPLSGLQRLNLTALVVFEQLLQSLFVAVIVLVFLAVFGLIAVPVSVQEGWIGGAVQPVVGFELLGEGRTISAELVTVASLLGGIVGLYFTGLSMTDPRYRGEQFDRAIAEVRLLLAARAVYLAATGLRPRTDA